MTSAICTLFEEHYHFGVGALANSLYAHGFRGTIYVGYRGPLPPWVTENKKSEIGNWESEMWTDFSPAEGLTLRFIPLTTTIHLTNYKPDFMLEVWAKHCPEAGAMFYFDPDITVKCRWTFFEEWVEAGVSVCADVNPSMPDNHPIRHAWRKLLTSSGLEFGNHFETYFNCGFIGITALDRDFLKEWQRIQTSMKNCGVDFQSLGVGDRTQPFTCRDQDALNIACMATKCRISPVGQDGMGFQYGGGSYIMLHSIGREKPWNKNYLQKIVRQGAAPSRADKHFFQNVKSPICLYRSSQLRFIQAGLLTASLLGRFIRNH